jgi:hypothetical protein
MALHSTAGAVRASQRGGAGRAPTPWPVTWFPGATGNLLPVKVTMLLCDAAQVSDGKLYILGGGWSMTGPDPVPSAVALKIDVDWHEAETSHHWELFLEDADGQPVFMETPDGTQPVEVRGEFTVSQPAEIPEGSPIDVALAVNLGPIPLAPATRFAWRLTIDGESLPGASLGFTTRPRQTVSE